MIRCTLSVCAEAVVRDTPSNAVSIFNVMEDVWTTAFPYVIPKLTALFMLTRDATDPENPECFLRINHGEHGDERFAVAGRFLGLLRTRVFVDLQGLPLRGDGTVRFTMIVNGEELGGWDMFVHRIAPEPPRVQAAVAPPEVQQQGH